MSGHNKWSKIKHKKAVTDAQKSKVFSKFSKLIQIESKMCGGDVNSPGLKSAIERARKENMPSSNIEKAVRKGLEKGGDNLESVTYEFYGPAGCGVIVEALTDNTNRTTAEIKHLLSKSGYSISTPGSVSWMFEKIESEWKPKTPMTLSDPDKEKLEKIIEQLSEHEDVSEIYHNS